MTINDDLLDAEDNKGIASSPVRVKFIVNNRTLGIPFAATARGILLSWHLPQAGEMLSMRKENGIFFTRDGERIKKPSFPLHIILPARGK